MRPRSERHRWFARLYWLQKVWEPLGLWRHRRAVARGVQGRALEIGIGTGFSLPYYETAPAVAIDPNIEMVRRAHARAATVGHKIAFVVAAGETLPFRDDAFDTVVSELVLCTADDPEAVLREAARAVRPDGQIRFLEHGASDRPWVAALQRALSPFWAPLNGGCRLERDPLAAFARAGVQPTKVTRCSAGTVARGTVRMGQR